MKRWLWIGVAVCLLIVVVFYYVSFNGNVLTKMIAQKKVETYMEQMYGESTAHFVKSGFDFKDGRYYFDYDIADEAVRAHYTFSIGGAFWLHDRIYTRLHDEDRDRARTDDFQRTGAAWLTAQLAAHHVTASVVEYNVQIPRGFYAQSVPWQPTVAPRIHPFIYIELNDEQQTEVQFLQQVETIQAILQQAHMTYDEAEVKVYRAVNDNGNTYYDAVYTTVFQPDTKTVTILE